MMYERPLNDDPAASNAYDALKNTADKVMQGLEKVREHKEINRRRWLWELVQNAKDLPNRFGRLSIKLVRQQDQLTFAHNGDPFRVRDVTALINQVSSKPSDSIDAQITGKYGTGFISTHLLSTTIEVTGVIQREGLPAKLMRLMLDREGNRSEDLIPKIEKARALVERIDSDAAFQDLPDYDTRRTEESFDTEFTYRLVTEDARETASVGLADLVNTLPYTLGNLAQVKRMLVEDMVTGRTLDYRCEVVANDGAIRKLRMTAGEQVIAHFISYDTDKLTLTVEVDGFERPRLKANFGEQPTLYRDFPLIGSEKFHFPFILNSVQLYPNEERSGIFLNDASSAHVITNRQVLERAMDLAVEFGQWLAERGARDRFVIAYSRMPEADMDQGAKEWYGERQRNWRTRILELPLVETPAGTTIPLKEAVIPWYSEDGSANAALWDLAVPFHGRGRLPRKDLLAQWLEALGPKEEVGSWNQGTTLIQGLEDLFKQVEGKGTLEALVLEASPEGEAPLPVDWIGWLFRFAIEQKERDLLDKYAVVPDQYGRFHKLGELCLEDPEARIPGAILDVMMKLGADWRSLLIDRRLDLGKTNHKRWGLMDASKKVTELLGGDRADQAFTSRADALDILFELLSIVPPEGHQSFRAELFRNGCRFYQRTGALHETSGCADFNFAPAVRLFLQFNHDRITECRNLEGLASLMAVSNDQAVLWLDSHLRSLAGNEEHKAFIERGNIIPNRYGELKGYDALYNYGTEDQPLDATLIDVLKALDGAQDWNQTLVGDGIGISLKETRSMFQLGKAIDDQVVRIWGKTASEPQLLVERQATLVALIHWCTAHESDATRFMPSFMQIKEKLVFDLIIRPNLSSGVIGLLGDKRYGAVLQSIHGHGMNIDQVKELLDVTGTLGSLDKIIDKAKEMLEDMQDFEYKKELGERMEQLLKEALDSEGFLTTLQGVGDYDISVTNPTNGKTFYIELKSTAQGSTDALKLAPSQAREWRTDVMDRALCLIERSKSFGPVTIEYVKEHLRSRTGLAHDLAKGNDAYAKFEAVQEGQELEIQLLGAVRVKLGRSAYLQGAGNYEQLIDAIRHALA